MEQTITVLVVDDNTANRELVIGRLTKILDSFHALEADDGREALNIAAKEHIDLVITDLQMQEMNGDELIEELLKQLPNLPIILASGAHAEARKIADRYEGKIKILCKPYRPDHLQGAMEELGFPTAHSRADNQQCS